MCVCVCVRVFNRGRGGAASSPLHRPGWHISASTSISRPRSDTGVCRASRWRQISGWFVCEIRSGSEFIFTIYSPPHRRFYYCRMSSLDFGNLISRLPFTAETPRGLESTFVGSRSDSAFLNFQSILCKSKSPCLCPGGESSGAGRFFCSSMTVG